MYILGIGNEESKCRYHQALKDGLYRKVGGAGAPGDAKENSHGHQRGTLLERLLSHVDDSLGNRNERE